MASYGTQRDPSQLGMPAEHGEAHDAALDSVARVSSDLANQAEDEPHSQHGGPSTWSSPRARRGTAVAVVALFASAILVVRSNTVAMTQVRFLAPEWLGEQCQMF